MAASALALLVRTAVHVSNYACDSVWTYEFACECVYAINCVIASRMLNMNGSTSRTRCMFCDAPTKTLNEIFIYRPHKTHPKHRYHNTHHCMCENAHMLTQYWGLHTLFLLFHVIFPPALLLLCVFFFYSRVIAVAEAFEISLRVHCLVVRVGVYACVGMQLLVMKKWANTKQN